MKGRIRINYGRKELELLVRKDAIRYNIRPADAEAVNDVDIEIQRALSRPVSSKLLNEIVKRGDKVVILADDITRPTPVRDILPHLLGLINNGGVPDKDICLIIALGTHRPMTQAEILQKYGEEVVKRIPVINHNYLDKKGLKHYGVTRRGTDIWVNRLVVEADIRIGIGNIVPHHPTGWSGGAKILLPGVAGEKTVGQFHLLGATEQLLGQIETPCREEMEDFARATGFDFLINTLMDREGKLVKIVTGHIIDAHREGVRCGRQIFGVPFREETDITVSSPYPVDFDLFQADKGIFSAAVSTKPGGEIILLSPCYEGVSPTHPEAVELSNLSDQELFRLAREEFDRHDPLSIAEVLYLNSAKRSYNITLVSDGISKEVAGKMNFNHIDITNLQNYIDSRLRNGASLGIIHNSAETLPVKED
jgi:nickel-dependent lactate racemase